MLALHPLARAQETVALQGRIAATSREGRPFTECMVRSGGSAAFCVVELLAPGDSSPHVMPQGQQHDSLCQAVDTARARDGTGRRGSARSALLSTAFLTPRMLLSSAAAAPHAAPCPVCPREQVAADADTGTVLGCIDVRLPAATSGQHPVGVPEV